VPGEVAKVCNPSKQGGYDSNDTVLAQHAGDQGSIFSTSRKKKKKEKDKHRNVRRGKMNG
jgi:hypothetical protein